MLLKKKIILYVQIQCDIFYVQTKRKCFVYSNLCKRKTDCNALPLCVCFQVTFSLTETEHFLGKTCSPDPSCERHLCFYFGSLSDAFTFQACITPACLGRALLSDISLQICCSYLLCRNFCAFFPQALSYFPGKLTKN